MAKGTPSPFKVAFLKLHTLLYLIPLGQILVTLPYLIAREAGKCSHLSGGHVFG